MKRAHYGFLALMLVLAPVAPSAQAQDGEIEPAALDVLKRATGFIASAKSLRATAEIGFDVVQESGRKLEFGMTGEITVRRPNRLRLDSERRDGTRRTLMFDGQHVTLFSPDDNVYAVVPKPGELDAALDYIQVDLQIPFALADLFYSDPASVLAGNVKSAYHVGEAKIAGVPCDHLALGNDQVDFEIWIERGKRPLPRRLVIAYKHEEGQPQFRSSIDWNVAPAVPDSAFVFEPPEGAERIRFAPTMRDEAGEGDTE